MIKSKGHKADNEASRVRGGFHIVPTGKEWIMRQYSRRNVLGLMGGVVAGGVGAGVLGFAQPKPALAAHQATEPEKGFSWTPRKLPDLAKVQLVGRERFYHNGWG